MTLMPAYGRTYNSVSAIAESLRKPEDWRGIEGFREAYTSLPEMISMKMNGYHEVRYGKNGMKVAMLEIKTDGTVTLNGKEM